MGAYEILAINLFSRHPPIEKTKKELNFLRKNARPESLNYKYNWL
jgi:hypothetical protein